MAASSKQPLQDGGKLKTRYKMFFNLKKTVTKWQKIEKVLINYRPI